MSGVHQNNTKFELVASAGYGATQQKSQNILGPVSPAGYSQTFVMGQNLKESLL